MRARKPMALAAAALAAALIAGCGSPKTSSSTAYSASACAKKNLEVHTKGYLTVATDSPAYPPYFENNKPANGKGLESAVAYAVAKQLGFSPSEVKWVVEPFDSSYAPGPKSFDFDINEISITKARAKAVDFSKPYYTDPQGIIVAANGPYAHVTKLSQLKGAKIGVQIGTTSLAAVDSYIKPTKQPYVYNTSNDVVEAFKIHSVQAIVVDLATAEYMVSAQIKHATISGKFNAPNGNEWGLLLPRGSALTACVNHAMTKLSSSGELAAISKRWFPQASSVPALK